MGNIERYEEKGEKRINVEKISTKIYLID